MSGTLLAYGDKVIGVVARASEYISITADGVKTYAQLFNELFAMVDTTKLTINAKLVRDMGTAKQVFGIGSYSSTAIDFSTISNDRVYYAYLTSSASTFKVFNMGNASYTNNSSSVATSGNVFSVYY